MSFIIHSDISVLYNYSETSLNGQFVQQTTASTEKFPPNAVVLRLVL
jgi:hypothetical protein